MLRLLFVQQVGAELPGALVGLFLLPAGDLGEVARKQDVGDPPAAEFGGAGVDRRRQQVVLKAVREGRGFVADGARNDAHDRVGDDAGRQLAARQHVVADRDFARDEVFADAVVDALVVAAEDDDVVERREPVGFVLVVADAVGRGVDDLVVVPLGLEFLDQFEDRFALEDHARFAAEGVVVGGLAAVVGVVVEVMDDDLDQPLLLRAVQDGFVERGGQQFGDDCQDVDAHVSELKN